MPRKLKFVNLIAALAVDIQSWKTYGSLGGRVRLALNRFFLIHPLCCVYYGSQKESRIMTLPSPHSAQFSRYYVFYSETHIFFTPSDKIAVECTWGYKLYEPILKWFNSNLWRVEYWNIQVLAPSSHRILFSPTYNC